MSHADWNSSITNVINSNNIYKTFSSRLYFSFRNNQYFLGCWIYSNGNVLLWIAIGNCVQPAAQTIMYAKIHIALLTKSVPKVCPTIKSSLEILLLERDVLQALEPNAQQKIVKNHFIILVQKFHPNKNRSIKQHPI